MDPLKILDRARARGSGSGSAGARRRLRECRREEAGAQMRVFCATLFFLKKLLESAKVTPGQRRVYDSRHFCASAKVAQNQRIICCWEISRERLLQKLLVGFPFLVHFLIGQTLA